MQYWSCCQNSCKCVHWCYKSRKQFNNYLRLFFYEKWLHKHGWIWWYFLVLKALISMQYYFQVFTVVRFASLHMLSPLLTFTFVNILTILFVNVNLVKARARVWKSTARVSPASPKIVRRRRISKIISQQRISPSIQDIDMSSNM